MRKTASNYNKNLEKYIEEYKRMGYRVKKAERPVQKREEKKKEIFVIK